MRASIPRLRHALVATVVGATALASGAALAQATTTSAVNVRAGPDRFFPTVTWVLGGTPAKVHGCVASWRWCDVTVGRDRGWIAASYLMLTHEGRKATVKQGGPALGIGAVEFSLPAYWSEHYAQQRWFGQAKRYQARWERQREQPAWTDPAATRKAP